MLTGCDSSLDAEQKMSCLRHYVVPLPYLHHTPVLHWSFLKAFFICCLQTFFHRRHDLILRIVFSHFQSCDSAMKQYYLLWDQMLCIFKALLKWQVFLDALCMARLIQPGLMPVCVSVVCSPRRCANTQLWISAQACQWGFCCFAKT